MNQSTMLKYETNIDFCSRCEDAYPKTKLSDCSDISEYAITCAGCEDDLLMQGHFDTCHCRMCTGMRAIADYFLLPH